MTSSTALSRPAPPRDREEARGRLVFALDFDTLGGAQDAVGQLAGAITFFKVGLELWARSGPTLAEELVRDGHDVFVDLKLHDIPATVAGAARAVADLGVKLLTLHGPPSAARAAAKAVGERTALLGVTVLTSVDEAEWRSEHGLPEGETLGDVVTRRARVLLDSGCAGLVCSAAEAAALRRAHPGAILLVPGIRLAGGDRGDQARVATPREAAAAGGDYFVVGRPIRDAADRRAVVEAIVDDLWAGFRDRASA